MNQYWREVADTNVRNSLYADYVSSIGDFIKITFLSLVIWKLYRKHLIALYNLVTGEKYEQYQ